MGNWILGVAVAAAIGAGLYYSYRKNNSGGKKKIVRNFETKTIDGELAFSDVQSWFKSLSLNKQNDVPFMALASTVQFAFPDDFVLTLKESDKKAKMFIGVYHEGSDEITKSLLILADSIDAKTKDVMGNAPLVVLN